MTSLESHVTVQKRAYYSPPWADVSIIGVAGSSGSGKSTLSQAIVKKLNLPWVVILSMVQLYLRHLNPPWALTSFRTHSIKPSRLNSPSWLLATSMILTPQMYDLESLSPARFQAQGVDRQSTSISWSKDYETSKPGIPYENYN